MTARGEPATIAHEMGATVQTRALRIDAERNLRRLLDAATQAFAEEGLGVSVAEIARRAQIGKGTVFRRFPTKEDLIAAILAHRLQEAAAIGTALLDAEDAGVGLLEFMRAGARLQAQDRGFFEAAAQADIAKEQVVAAKEGLLEITAQLLHRAQRAGAVRDDITPEDILLLECASVQAAAPFHELAPELWQRYLDLVFDGMRAQGAHRLSHPAPSNAQLAQAHVRAV